LVTFGTPIRYGWDADGFANLLHFIYHRPREGLTPYRTVMPRTPTEVLHATDGDYIQQWGVAGTNLLPDAVAWRTWLAELRLHKLLQGQLRVRDLPQRLGFGQRVPQDGRTLLVDYSLDPQSSVLAGHAVYTRIQWLEFHVAEVARYFYAARDYTANGRIGLV
jgi:hypothetical protein